MTKFEIKQRSLVIATISASLLFITACNNSVSSYGINGGGNGGSTPGGSGNTVTDLQAVDTSSSAQTNVPITFGPVFKVGELASGTSVAGTGTVNGSIPLQVNVKATHGDGSVRHAIISAVLPNLGSGQTETITFTSTADETGLTYQAIRK